MIDPIHTWSSWLFGALLGYGVGCLTYGGIGFLLYGQLGLALGIAVATALAAYGLTLVNPHRMPELFRDDT
jgi:hypothetical protein